ncbi:MAG: GntR family transcriptional regulator, partial [Roseicyclus sp.]
MARTPLYKAAETEMIRRIESGEWEVGRRLPNEFVLAEEFKVSQGTMRRALMTLEGQGLLAASPGGGPSWRRPTRRGRTAPRRPPRAPPRRSGRREARSISTSTGRNPRS